MICHLCRGNDLRVVFTDGGYSLLRCSGCGLGVTHPAPSREQLSKLYSSRAGPYGREMLKRISGDEDVRRKIDQRTREQIQCLNRYGGGGGRLLDVGCATGEFLSVARGLGWQVQGVELSSEYAEQCRDRGNAVFCGELAEAGFPDGSFDCATLWDVLEHSADPRVLLSEARRVLADGGHLIIRCPNIDGLFHRVTYWFLARTHGSWEFPQFPYHLYHFSKSSLARMVEEQYQIIGVETRAEPEHYYTGGLAAQGQGFRMRIKNLASWAGYSAIVALAYPFAAMLDCRNAVVIAAEKTRTSPQGMRSGQS